MKIRYGSKKAAVIDSFRALESVFGGSGSMIAVVLVVLAIVFIGWLGDSLYRMWFSGAPAWWGVAPFAILFALTGLVFRRLPELTPSIDEHLSRPAVGMIMFLSPTHIPEKDAAYTEADLPVRDSWEMPMLAIKQHWQRESLKYVVVVPSSDSSGKEDGTWKLLDRFRKLIGDVVGVPHDCIINLPAHAHGVDFESAEELWHAVQDAIGRLRELGIRDEGIVIDITGGQKMPAVMGGVAGLGSGLRLQYMSTKDKRLLEYDVTIQVER